MSLQDVVTEVHRDGEAQAQEILQHARKEAENLLAAARQKAQAHERERMADATRAAEQVLQQARSRAASEARKIVLTAEAGLRRELLDAVLESFRGLPQKARSGHVEKLVQRAAGIVASGRVWGAAADQDALKAQSTYEVAGTVDVAGGIIVESTDRTTRLDLSYETLLADMWRDVLRQEAALFA